MWGTITPTLTTCVAVLLGAPIPPQLHAPRAPSPAQQLVAVFPFNNADADPSLEDWRYGFAALIPKHLSNAGRVATIDASDVVSQLKQIGWSEAGPITAEVAGTVGRDLRANHVIWGDYVRREGAWLLHVHITQSGATNSLAPLQMTARSSADLLVEVSTELAINLGSPIHPIVVTGWRNRPSPDCGWDVLAEVASLELKKAPEAEREARLRQLVNDEPTWAAGRVSLAAFLAEHGQDTEAEWELEQAARLAPDWCTPRLGLALVSLRHNDRERFERELHEALRAHPGCKDACGGLMFALHDDDRWPELSEIFEAALAEDPTQLCTIAFAAQARAHLGDRAGAERYLEQVTDLRDESPLPHLAIAETAALTDRPDVLVREARVLQRQRSKQPLAAMFLQSIDETFYLRPKEATRPLPRPRSDLRAELEARLKEIQSGSGVELLDPLEVTPQISKLAETLTDGMTNQALRAMLIFDEVLNRGRGEGQPGIRTAAEAFLDSDQAESRFSCQEYAKLYVTLARCAGLPSWLVHVEVDVEGRAVDHDCAAIFLPGFSFLVDRAYTLFCAEHRQFRILDDLQAIAHQAMQRGKPEDYARLQAGLQLDPDDSWVQLRCIRGLAVAGRPDEAEAALAKHPELSSRWDYHMVVAAIAIVRNRWHNAAAALREAIALAPSNPALHVTAANVYSKLEDFSKAREHAEQAARLDESNFFQTRSPEAQTYLAATAALELSRSPQPAARVSMREQAEAGDPAAQFGLAASLLQADPPDPDEALRWLRKAADHGDSRLEREYARVLVTVRGPTAASEALDFFTRSAEKGDPDAQYQLGMILYDGKLTRADPVTAYRWALLARNGGNDEARSLLQEMELFLDKSQIAKASEEAKQFKARR